MPTQVELGHAIRASRLAAGNQRLRGTDARPTIVAESRIRIALGAVRARVLRLVLGPVGRLVAAGGRDGRRDCVSGDAMEGPCSASRPCTRDVRARWRRLAT
ncbi:MAG TPA: hypothetical protein VFS59_03265 [Gemmatimonadaceae bacterium]|nr:hypothetical protein [Gemmatimonadaceae bacterium]